ncbi:MAG: hypothetical protein ACTXOO_02410 [Sodalis sp. (in: enterobacteria)]
MHLLFQLPTCQESLPSVRNKYLHTASTWVMGRETTLTGFISVLRDKAKALFVAFSH